eukprot:TRINITY_DN5527_c0_g1_i1.p1 TRINITY_DN5527_c0_g1~~TRINITY_DN5527_c0_g1_i1.p1  ORF type:complete len:243 (+),score=8.81 TRINITY_DN5527_c0_g1_i1:153-881(+)
MVAGTRPAGAGATRAALAACTNRPPLCRLYVWTCIYKGPREAGLPMQSKSLRQRSSLVLCTTCVKCGMESRTRNGRCRTTTLSGLNLVPLSATSTCIGPPVSAARCVYLVSPITSLASAYKLPDIAAGLIRDYATWCATDREWVLLEAGCIECGCTAAVDDCGVRACWCDSCWRGGCKLNAVCWPFPERRSATNFYSGGDHTPYGVGDSDYGNGDSYYRYYIDSDDDERYNWFYWGMLHSDY